MRPPLSALLIAPDVGERYHIEHGGRRLTIRQGHRDYRVGQPVMLCCHIVPWCVMADIVEVRHCTLGTVTGKDQDDAGYIDREAMLTDLRHHYPEIDLESPVTVIRWTNVRGKLASND